jgi:hypothetical protein
VCFFGNSWTNEITYIIGYGYINNISLNLLNMKNMKTILISLLVCITTYSSFAQITNPAPYCDASYEPVGMASHYISNVSLNTLDNNSGTTQYASPHYVFYNNLAITDLNKGATYDLKITYDNFAWTHVLVAWIDFNHDGDFDDADEKIGQKDWPSGIGNEPNVEIISFTVPSGALLGKARMRIRNIEEDDVLGVTAYNYTPCKWDNNGTPQVYNSGETEDYTVNITSSPTGIDNQKFDNYFSVYPNPTKGLFTIKNDSQKGINEIKIIDLLGKEVKTLSSLNESVEVIDVSSMNKGIYLIQLIDDKNKVYTKKLVIE